MNISLYILNVFNFQQRLLFRHSSNHRYKYTDRDREIPAYSEKDNSSNNFFRTYPFFGDFFETLYPNFFRNFLHNLHGQLWAVHFLYYI